MGVGSLLSGGRIGRHIRGGVQPADTVDGHGNTNTFT